MPYWENLHFTDGIAEAAISDSHTVLTEARRRSDTNDPMRPSEAHYKEALGNLMFLIEGVPDSDVLRAEQLAFRAQSLANIVGKAVDIRDSDDALAKVQARPAYRALLVK